MDKVRALSGQCTCGTVRYAVADAFRYAANCHCRDCRRTTGAAFKPFAGIERNQLGFVAGVDEIMIVGEEISANDVRCRRCFALLYSVVRQGAWVHVAMGALTDDPAIRPRHHIFVTSKAPWFTITDGLPQYEGHAPG